jgi:hypothetical protein
MAAKRANMRSRPMRWYTAGIALVTGAAVATAIEMRSEADQAQKAHVRATALQAYVTKAEHHADQTKVALGKLTHQYDEALLTARQTQSRMLADLRKARKAARSAKNKTAAAPVVYATTFSVVAGVSPAAGGAPTSGTS